MKDIWQRNSALLKLTGLIGILLFAFWVGMDPHWESEYPMHVDEWDAMGFTDAMLEEGKLTYDSPYNSEGEISYGSGMGFHLLLGSIKSTSGLSWMGLYRIAPGIVVALLAYLVYALGRREGFGWISALFVPLIPTSIRTLGPSFLVPVAIAMLFIPVTLLVLHRLDVKRNRESLWLLMLLVCGTLFVHPATEGVVSAMVVLYLIVYILEALSTKEYRNAGKLVVAIAVRMAIPVILLGLWMPSITKNTVEESITGDSEGIGGGLTEYFGYNEGFIEAFGLIAVGLFFVGIFIYTLSRPYGMRSYIIPIFVVLLVLFLMIVYPEYRLGPGIFYERAWSYLGLFMAILAGYAVWWYIKSVIRRLKSYDTYSAVGGLRILLIILGFGIAVTAITTGITNQERDNYAAYYQMVGEKIHSDFTWLGKHTERGEGTLMMEPSLAWAYPPITGPGYKVTIAAAFPFEDKMADQASNMIVTGDYDIDWLKKHDVAAVYTRLPQSQQLMTANNNDFIEVKPGIYIVPGS
ncbi:MAG: hypothetical protein HQ553_07300 [Chloroflexi bacterium]|nr:hypothetical protein [Chloroflexota bacterium]